MHYPDGVSDVTDPRGDLEWGTLPGLVQDAAARFGEAEAVVDRNGPGGTTTRWSFDRLAEEVATATRAVVAHGIEPGDRVAVWAPNCAEWIVAALGAVGAGAVLVPLNTRYKGAEAAYILRASGARILFTVQGFLGTDYPAMLDEAVAAGEAVPDLERVVVLRTDGRCRRDRPAVRAPARSAGRTFLAAADRCEPDVAAGRTAAHHAGDLSDLVFTSGTTGHPKGAMTTHGQTLRTFATWAEVVGLRAGDRYLIVNPFFHTFGYKAGILACLMAGATMVPEPVFDVDVVLQRVADERISVLPGPPTIFQSILDHPQARRLRPVDPAPGGDRCRGRAGGAGRVALVRHGHRDGPHRLRPDRGHRHGHHVPTGRLGRGDLGDVGTGHPRRRGAHRRRRRQRGARPARRARSWCAATTSCPATSTTPRPPRRPSTPTAGCTPVTSASSTTTATWPSPTG